MTPSAYCFSKISKYGNTAHTYAYFGFYSIYTSKNMPNYWTDFDALLHTNYILVSDVTRRIFFSKISKNGNPAHTFAYFAFYPITQKLLNQIWPDFTYSFLDGFLNFLSFQFFQNMATLHKKRIQKTEILLNRYAPGFFSLYAPKAPSKCYRRRRRLAHGAPMMYTVCPKKKHSREATILKARSAII